MCKAVLGCVDAETGPKEAEIGENPDSQGKSVCTNCVRARGLLDMA